MERDRRLLQFQPREIVGSVAFDMEKEKVYTDVEMRDDLVSYLGEYRLRVQKHDYELTFSYREGEGYRVRDIHRGEAMSVKSKRTLLDRTENGLPVYREMAEDAGIDSLDEQLLYAEDGDMVVWFSPPGPKDQGYGNYGFMFEGSVKVKVLTDGMTEKHILMTANRIEKPTIAQCNNAFFALTGEDISFINPEGFLANPRVVSGREVNVDEVLLKNFSFEVNEEEMLVNTQVIKTINPMIDEFVGVIKSGSREERITAFYALENYALELKERLMRKQEKGEENVIYMSDYRDYRYLADILHGYGYRPPIVAGSCGPTGEDTRSNDIFADNYKDLMKAIFGDFKEMFGIEDDEWFVCGACHYKATGPIGNQCPGCHITKEEYAKKTGQPVCA